MRRFPVYHAFFIFALRSEIRQWRLLIGRLIFFGIVMVIFAELWRAIFRSGIQAEGTPAQMLWYLAVTEWIVLSTPSIHVQIEEDVRSGGVLYHLGRPVSYTWMRLVEGVGQLIGRMLTVGIVGVALAFTATGEVPPVGVAGLWLVPLCLLGAFVLLAFQASIGHLALWCGEATPLYWVWQKLLFILGGLMLPLSVYPEVVRLVSSATPFYAILYAPARLVINFSLSEYLTTLSLLLGWAVVSLALLSAIERRVVSTITVDGG